MILGLIAIDMHLYTTHSAHILLVLKEEGTQIDFSKDFLFALYVNVHIIVLLFNENARIFFFKEWGRMKTENRDSSNGNRHTFIFYANVSSSLKTKTSKFNSDLMSKWHIHTRCSSRKMENVSVCSNVDGKVWMKYWKCQRSIPNESKYWVTEVCILSEWMNMYEKERKIVHFKSRRKKHEIKKTM